MARWSRAPGSTSRGLGGAARGRALAGVGADGDLGSTLGRRAARRRVPGPGGATPDPSPRGTRPRRLGAAVLSAAAGALGPSHDAVASGSGGSAWRSWPTGWSRCRPTPAPASSCSGWPATSPSPTAPPGCGSPAPPRWRRSESSRPVWPRPGRGVPGSGRAAPRGDRCLAGRALAGGAPAARRMAGDQPAELPPPEREEPAAALRDLAAAEVRGEAGRCQVVTVRPVSASQVTSDRCRS
jgi:hypothetical protein